MIKVPGIGSVEERLRKLEQSVNFSPMIMGIAAVGGDDAGSGGGVGAHELLSAEHTDTVVNAVTRGSLIYGNTTPAWDELTIGAADRFLGSDGTDAAWTAPGALTRVDDTNVTLTLGGTPSTALLRATSLTLGWTGQLAISRGGTGLSALGTGVQTWLGTPSSANLAAAITDETGSGALVFATSPTLVTPALGTPASGTLTNCTGLPISTGVAGLGANVATFLATPSSANLMSAVTDETGSGALVFATSPTLVTPALGTPSSGTLTNCTGLPISTGVSGLGAGVATWLATPSSANLRSALTDETGTGAAVFADTPTLVTPILGTPTSGTLTNCTGLPVSTGISGLGAGVATFLATPSSANLASAVTDETGSGVLVFGTSPTFTTGIVVARTAAVVNSADSVGIDLTITANSDGSTGGFYKAIKLSGTLTQNVAPGTISHKFLNNDLLHDLAAGSSLVNFSTGVHRMTTRANGVTINGAGGATLAWVDEQTFSSTGGGAFSGSLSHTSFWSNPTFSTAFPTRYGLRITDPGGAGALTTQVGVELESLTRAATNISLRSAGTATLRHAGNVRIGDTGTAPTDALEVIGNVAMTGSGTLYGSTASSGTLTLESTRDSTKSLINARDELRFRTALTSITTGLGGGTATAYYYARANLALQATDALNTITVLGATGTFDDRSVNLVYLFNNTATISRSTTLSTAAFSTMAALNNNPTFQSNGLALTSGTCIGFSHAPITGVINAGTITGFTDEAMRCQMTVGANTTVATRRGLHFQNASVTGTLTTQVAVEIAALTTATTNIGIRNASATVNTPTVQAITAATDTIPITATVVRLNNTSGGSVTLTATPIIAAGQDGQILVLFNSSANNVVLTNGAANNLLLAGGANLTLGTNDTVTLMYSTTIGDWIQLAASNN